MAEVTFSDFIPKEIKEGPEEFVRVLTKQEGTRIAPGYVSIDYNIVPVTIQIKSDKQTKKIKTLGKLVKGKAWDSLDGRLLVVPGVYTGVYSCPGGAWIAIMAHKDVTRTVFIQDTSNRRNTAGSLRIGQQPERKRKRE